MANTTARGYGYQHQQTRKALAPLVATGTVKCTLCPELIKPGEPWDLDHADGKQAYRGPAHASCNRSEGAARGNRQRRRVTSRDWWTY